MLPSRLKASTLLSETEWIASRLRPFGDHRVASVVPDGFASYVRILHPARLNGIPLTWAQVADRTGRRMHALAQYHAVARSSSVSGAGSILGLDPPDVGNLPPDLLRAVCDSLKDHTATGESCWFCVWEGYGWADKAPAIASAKVELPARNYFLLGGPLDAAPDLGWMLTPDFLVPQSPNLFWPQDRTWCVASEIDLFCTLVAGSEDLIDSLMADHRLETWRVSAEDLITWKSDEINK